VYIINAVSPGTGGSGVHIVTGGAGVHIVTGGAGVHN